MQADRIKLGAISRSGRSVFRERSRAVTGGPVPADRSPPVLLAANRGQIGGGEKGHDLAVRCDINPPSIERIDMKTTVGRPASYQLLSIPVYLAERIADFIDQMQDHPS